MNLRSVLRDSFTGRQLEPTVILFLSSVLLLVWRYYGTPEFWTSRVFAGWPKEQGEAAGAVAHLLCTLVLLGILPAAIVRFGFRRSLREFGVQFGIPVRTIRTLLLFTPFFVLGGYLATNDPGIRAKFPVNPHAGTSAAMFALHTATLAAYYAGWEFYFRGFMLWGLRDTMGDTNAVLIQVMASSLLHIGSPASETFGAVLGGLLWGMLALRTRSILSGFGQHFALGLSVDWFLCYG